MGHTLTTCFRDPNMRTNADMAEEKKRLKEIGKNKKRTSQSFEIQGKISAMLSNRSVMLHENYLNFDEDDIIFDDLDDIRDEFDFEDAKNSNRYIIDLKNGKKEEPQKPKRMKTGLSVFTNLGYES